MQHHCGNEGTTGGIRTRITRATRSHLASAKASTRSVSVTIASHRPRPNRHQPRLPRIAAHPAVSRVAQAWCSFSTFVVWPGENNSLDRLNAPSDCHRASLELIGRDACRLGGCHTNDHLACSRSGCESGRDVDGITECGEVLDGGAEAGRANECLAGVDGRSYWDGRLGRRAGLCHSLSEVDCSRYCCCRVARPGDSAEEESDNLIAHDFVNDAVMGNDRIRCQSVEAVQECVEVGGGHTFPQGCRAADIGEQQGDRDLHTRQLAFTKVGYASRAQSGIAGGLPEPRVPEDEATRPRERSCAQLATGRGRDSSE